LSILIGPLSTNSEAIVTALGPVVQRWVSAYPVLKFNLLFLYFYTSVYFKTSEIKTPIDPDKISEEIFPNL
jgi:hypothetical protein